MKLYRQDLQFIPMTNVSTSNILVQYLQRSLRTISQSLCPSRPTSSAKPHVHGVSASIWMLLGCRFHDRQGQRTNQVLFSPRKKTFSKHNLRDEDKKLYPVFPHYGLRNIVLFVSPVQHKVLGSS